MRPIRDSLGKTLRPFHHTQGFFFGILVNHWEKITDEPLIHPVSLDRDKLTVVGSSAAAVKLAHMQLALAQKINAYFGRRLVGHIHIKIGVVPAKVVRISRALEEVPMQELPETENVQHEELKEALNRLGSRMKAG